jgi:hypothetical protein
MIFMPLMIADILLWQFVTVMSIRTLKF